MMMMMCVNNNISMADFLDEWSSSKILRDESNESNESNTIITIAYSRTYDLTPFKKNWHTSVMTPKATTTTTTTKQQHRIEDTSEYIIPFHSSPAASSTNSLGRAF